jgi:hypothetical protein
VTKKQTVEIMRLKSLGMTEKQRIELMRSKVEVSVSDKTLEVEKFQKEIMKNEVNRKIIMMYSCVDGYYSITDMAKELKISTPAMKARLRRMVEKYPEYFERLKPNRLMTMRVYHRERNNRFVQMDNFLEEDMSDQVVEKF